MTCERCGVELEIGMYPFCPHGEPLRGRGADVTWPGGKTFENLGHEPVTFYSPTEKARYLRQHGIEEYVRHQPVPGSDRSPHTTRWNAVPDLDGARQMLERIGQGAGHAPEPQTWVERFIPATESGVTTVRGQM
jgi:hypothetical protein